MRGDAVNHDETWAGIFPGKKEVKRKNLKIFFLPWPAGGSGNCFLIKFGFWPVILTIILGIDRKNCLRNRSASREATWP